jgi:hypothetical protein
LTLHIEAPSRKFLTDSKLREKKSIFLAGGITNAPNWQPQVAKLLERTGVLVVNPRRKGDFRRDKHGNWLGIDAEQQIAWEHEHLRLVDAILFWFPYPAKCAITLFELGSWLKTRKPIFVGVDPKYCRKMDVEIQLKLEAPHIKIAESLPELTTQATNFMAYWEK